MEIRTSQLKRAAAIWQESLFVSADDRLRLAHELGEMEIFSNRQISKISRVSTSTLARSAMRARSGGGRLDPATLTAMVYVREAVVQDKPLPMPLIRSIVNGGTSLSNLCRLTGAPRASLYNKIKED